MIFLLQTGVTEVMATAEWVLATAEWVLATAEWVWVTPVMDIVEWAWATALATLQVLVTRD